RGSNVVAEALAYAIQLGDGLQREQKGDVAPARGLKDLREVTVGERREFVEDNAYHGRAIVHEIAAAAVALSHHQLQILQQHPSECGYGPGIAIDIERDEQDELLIDHIVEIQQIVIRAGDLRQLVGDEDHQLVNQSLDFGDALAVLQRLQQVLGGH